jgi:histidinol dehydrogenase
VSDCETVETKGAVALAEINGKFDQMLQSIDTVKEKQDEMADDISKIKEAVYNPDSGLYARLRELENWKQTSSRIIWMVVTAVISLAVATVYKSII